ncbi:MAG TPA: hypothetical protein VF790_05710 [Dissulfurispiraceae bacterium]
MAKTQCWEYMKCGREKNSSCPAVAQYAGRSCWLVAGTLCGGKVQGTRAQQIQNCKLCDFYMKAKSSEI